MVKIPTKLSEGTLSTQTTANKINDIESFTRNSVAIQRAGQVLGTISEDFKRLETLRQVTRATTESNRILSEKESIFLDNPDLNESDVIRFNQEAEESIQTQLATVGNEEARLRLGVTLRGTALVKGFNVKRQARQVGIDKAIVETDILAAQYILDSFKSGPAERSIIRDNFRIHLNNNIVGKLTTREKAAIALTDFDESVRAGRAGFMLASLTAAVEGRSMQDRVEGAIVFKQQIEEGKEYPELTIDEEKALIKDVEDFITRGEFKIKFELEQAQEKFQDEQEDPLLDFKLTAQEVRAMGIKGQVSKEWIIPALAYLALANPEAIETDNATYANLYDMIMGDLLNEETGRGFTKKEVQEAMLGAAKDLKLAPAQFRELKKLRNTDFSSIDKGIISNEVKGIRAWALGILGPGETFMSAKSETKAKVDAIEVIYKRRLIEEGAKGKSIKLISKELQDELGDSFGKLSVTELLGAATSQVVTIKGKGSFRKTGKDKWTRIKE